MTEIVRRAPALLSTAEFLVLLFLVERRLPYGKDSDRCTLAQFVDGIRKRDGEWIRYGCRPPAKGSESRWTNPESYLDLAPLREHPMARPYESVKKSGVSTSKPFQISVGRDSLCPANPQECPPYVRSRLSPHQNHGVTAPPPTC